MDRGMAARIGAAPHLDRGMTFARALSERRPIQDVDAAVVVADDAGHFQRSSRRRDAFAAYTDEFCDQFLCQRQILGS